MMGYAWVVCPLAMVFLLLATDLRYRALKRLCELYERVIEDDCESEAMAAEAARAVLGDWVDGDDYAPRCRLEIVERLAAGYSEEVAAAREVGE